MADRDSGSGVESRRVALQALARIDDGGFANLVLPALLSASRLSDRDRRLATDLVYGTTRMRRALDRAVQPHLRRELDPPTRAALRLGAYQLLFLKTPPHAAVSATVGAVEGPARGLVNAVLRKVAAIGEPAWTSEAERLSYPDWIVDLLTEDHGQEVALDALRTMNEPPAVHTREDGYVQDPASTLVAEAVGAQPGDLVLDLSAAPGGKATWMARTGAHVVAVDIQPHRVRLVAENSESTGVRQAVSPVVADGTRAPFVAGAFDRVLVDAPCSGLGVLRRRPDARWRITPEDIEDLVGLQRRLLGCALAALKPGGTLVFSVCTITRRETATHDRWLAERAPDLLPVPPPQGWRPAGRGALLLPQDKGTDGMFLLTLRQRAR